MSLRESQLTQPLTLSRLAADVSWGLMMLQRTGATPEVRSRIESGILLCDTLQAAASGEIASSESPVSDLQSNLIMGSKRNLASDIDLEAAVRALLNLVTPFKPSLKEFRGAVNVDEKREQLKNTREFFGKLAVTLQELGL